MAIDERNIVVGGLYKTHTNQERVVLEIKDDEVKYAPRGGNVENKFEIKMYRNSRYLRKRGNNGIK